MHILQINTEKGWRGGERQTLLLMEGLRDAGIMVTLLGLRRHPLEEKAKRAGFPVIAVSGQWGIVWHCVVHGKKYSILHAQSARAFGFTVIAAFFNFRPVIYTRRAEFVPHGMLTRMKYRRASAIVAISTSVQTVLRTANMGDSEIISSIVVSPRRNETRITAIKKKHAIAQQRIVGVVAALTREKDPLGMIRAAAIVLQRLPDIVFLHFGTGDLMKTAEHETERLGITERYLFMGFQEHVEEVFGMFDLFVMSSLREGLGSSVLDAFAAGIPVAATDAGGLAELVDGRGLLSPKGDPESLAQNIQRLLTDKNLSGALAKKANAYVFKEHGVGMIIGKYLHLYGKFSSGGGI